MTKLQCLTESKKWKLKTNKTTERMIVIYLCINPVMSVSSFPSDKLKPIKEVDLGVVMNWTRHVPTPAHIFISAFSSSTSVTDHCEEVTLSETLRARRRRAAGGGRRPRWLHGAASLGFSSWRRSNRSRRVGK